MMQRGQPSQLPVSHGVTGVSNSTLTTTVYPQPFCFSFSVQESINYMLSSTFSYKISFVLADFVQLLANLSLST